MKKLLVLCLVIFPLYALAENPKFENLYKNNDSSIVTEEQDYENSTNNSGSIADLYECIDSVRPFIEYRTSLLSTGSTKVKQDGKDIVQVDTLSLNSNSSSFVFGVEINNSMALSISPSISSVETKVKGGDTTNVKTNSIDFEADVYLNRNQNFKTFVALDIGYMSLDTDFKTSGLVLGFGIGLRQHLNDNVYFGAGLSYFITEKMGIRKLYGVSVDDVDVRVSGLGVSIGIGYRF